MTLSILYGWPHWHRKDDLQRRHFKHHTFASAVHGRAQVSVSVG